MRDRATARRLGEVLRADRVNPANAPIRKQAEAIIARLEAGERVSPEGIHPALQPLFRPAVQGFLMSAFALDLAELIASYAGPVLISTDAASSRSGKWTRTVSYRPHQVAAA